MSSSSPWHVYSTMYVLCPPRAVSREQSGRLSKAKVDSECTRVVGFATPDPDCQRARIRDQGCRIRSRGFLDH